MLLKPWVKKILVIILIISLSFLVLSIIINNNYISLSAPTLSTIIPSYQYQYTPTPPPSNSYAKFTPTPTTTPTPTPTLPTKLNFEQNAPPETSPEKTTLKDTTLTNLVLPISFEKNMKKDVSYIIEVKLQKREDLPIITATTFRNLKRVGESTTSIEHLFEDNYKPYAYATLHGPTFDIQPSETQKSSLDIDSIQWKWIVMPKQTGKQQLLVNLTFVWEPINGNTAPEETYQLGEEALAITVTEDHIFIILEKINIGTIITSGFPIYLQWIAAVIASMSSYLLFGDWKKRKKKKRRY